jgi:hypothetical protein
MKNIILLIFSLCLPFLSFSQETIAGQVVDEQGKGLPFVNITINTGGTGGTTDLDGNFDLYSKNSIRSLNFSYIGFDPLTLSGPNLKKDAQKVVLKENTTTLLEVEVLPGKNPAHRMVENAIRNKKANDPEELDEFSYYAYSKFFITLNIDSIDPRIDTIMMSDKIDSLKGSEVDTVLRVDSSNYALHEFFSSKHLFFMETLTERRFKRPRDNEEVLAQRTSGFKNPMFALLVTQLQSFSFYQDYIGISGGEYLNPISKGSTNRYYFIIEDSLFTEEGDTIFTLSFRPRPNKGFKALQGAISIDSRDWAIVNVRAVPAESDGIPIEIRQSYERFGPHTWFPTSFDADIELPMISVNTSSPKAIMRRKLMRINLEPGLERKDISRAELSITDKKEAEVDSLLREFRGEELDSVEQTTYPFIDSVSKAENIEQNLNLLLTLRRGYIPLKYVNLDIGSVLNYNTYEGIRLGAGIESPASFSEWFRIGGYYAYGFKDKAHKYGGHIDMELHKNLRWEIFGRYKSDIFETSGFAVPGIETGSWTDNNYRRIYVEQWDYAQILSGGMRIDPFPTMGIELQAQHERRQTLGNYLFRPGNNSDLNRDPRSQFRFSELSATFRFAPEEKYAETPFGKIKLNTAYPVFHLHLSKGLKDLWGGEFDYTRALAQIEYKHLSRGFGEASFRLRAAAVWGDVPVSKLYTPAANYRTISNQFEANLGSVADRNSFETMRFNEFLSDRFVSFMWRQDFRSILYKKGNFAPHIEMVHRIAWGSLENSDFQKNIGFTDLRNPDTEADLILKDLRNPYLESGIELNRLYSSNFVAIGIGAYYRYGAQQLSEPIDNFAFKLSSKFAF